MSKARNYIFPMLQYKSSIQKRFCWFPIHIIQEQHFLKRLFTSADFIFKMKHTIALLAYAFELKAPLMNKTRCKQRQVSIENCIALNMFFHSGKIHYSLCKKKVEPLHSRRCKT